MTTPDQSIMYRFVGLDNEQQELGKIEAASAQDAQQKFIQQHPNFHAIGTVEKQVNGSWESCTDYPQ